MNQKRDQLNLARAGNLKKAAESCSNAALDIGKMVTCKSEEEFNIAIRSAAKNLAETLNNLSAVKKDTDKFISENKGE